MDVEGAERMKSCAAAQELYGLIFGAVLKFSKIGEADLVGER